MPRERTTWNHEEIAKKAALTKKADPYLMNQDHVKGQPSADKYTIGDPSDFAEDVHPSKGTWEAEYANGQVKRNEIGMPEMRSDTFNHPEKTAAQVEAEIVKKAALAVNVARAMLKSASNSAVEDQAARLMKLSDEDLVATYKAIVAEDDDEGQDDADEQDKQAGELPPWLKKDDDKKDDDKKDDDKKEEKKAQDQGQQQDKPEEKQAQDQAEEKKDQDQGKQAQLDQVAQLSQVVSQLQQQVAQMQQAQAPQVVQAQAQDEKKEEPAQEQKQAQMDQQAQAQQIQSAMQQAIANGQDPIQAAQQAIQSCMGQPMANDADLIDDMLTQQDQHDSGMGIELEAANMDTGDLSVTADDAILNQLFASQEDEDAQQAQGQQQKQAAVRTASTRTVGTRPTQGVSQLGGLPSAGKGGDNKLENIWASAPDVREVFGTR